MRASVVVKNVTCLCFRSSVSLDHEIMKDFTIAKDGSAVTTVYAFRFMDSLTVTLQCKVHVCMDKSCSVSV